MAEVFNSIFSSEVISNVAVGDFMICLLTALGIGLIISLGYVIKNDYTKSFVTTLALLPAVVCVVIMVVNGNIGAGVAVAGAFSLVRFRSAPGTAKEIVAIFLSMGAGLVAGMGYLAFAVLFTLIMSLVFVCFNIISSHTPAPAPKRRTVKITVPEDLDYTGAFEEIFAEYTTRCELVRVKTVNMGSMFRLTFDVCLKDAKSEKEMIDKLRIRNGNLEIMVSRQESSMTEL